MLPPKGGGGLAASGLCRLPAGNSDVPKKPTPHQRAPRSPRGQRSRRELGMGDGVRLAAEGTGARRQAVAPLTGVPGAGGLDQGPSAQPGRGTLGGKEWTVFPEGRPLPAQPLPRHPAGFLSLPRGDWGRQPSGHTPSPGLQVGAAGGTLPSQTHPGAEQAGPPSSPLLSAGSVGCGRKNGQHRPEGGVTMHEASSTRKPPPAGPERHRLGWVRTLQKWVRG